MQSEAEEEAVQLPLGTKLLALAWTSVTLVTLFSYWQDPFILNLVSAFRLQLLLLLILLTVPALFLFPGKKKILAAGLPLVFAMTFLSYLVPVGPEAEPGEDDLSFVVANVYSGNPDISGLVQWLEKESPDVLAVLEVSNHHIPSLEALGYRYTMLEPRGNHFGIALLSKTEPLTATVIDKESPFPSIVAEFEDYVVLAVHAMPPLSKEARMLGEDQIKNALAATSGIDKPRFLLGDLNATGWDQRVLDLQDAGFKDCRKGKGILPTWPVGRPLMYIPIDHVLTPKNAIVLECQVGPAIGSDHFPLKAVVQLPKPSAKMES